MNVASRMETTGQRARVQLSESTALLLTKADCEEWIEERKDVVNVKGKGQMRTYWLLDLEKHVDTRLLQRGKDVAFQQCPQTIGKHSGPVSDRNMRLVEWNVSVLFGYLRLITFRQERDTKWHSLPFHTDPIGNNQLHEPENSRVPLEEVKEIVEVLEFDCKVANSIRQKRTARALNSMVKEQLTNYVTAVAGLYPENAFHNFAHAVRAVSWSWCVLTLFPKVACCPLGRQIH